MKVSCFTVMQRKRELEEVIPDLARLGYSGIELMGAPPHLPPDTALKRAEDIKMLADEHKIPIIGIAGYSGNFVGQSADHCAAQLADLEKYCKLANLFGCDLVRYGPGGSVPYRAEEAHYREAAEGMKKACDLAAKYNVRLVMEIHNGGLIESAEDVMRLILLTGRGNLGAIHDAGNMYISSTDHSEKSVSILGDRLFHVHIKDELRIFDEKLPNTFYCPTRRGNELLQATLLDQGGTDHRPLLRGLKAMGYRGYLSLECMIAADDPSVPEKEITALKKMMNECG
jgi:L-ribulose-5-phosphate 3-epimerase